MSGFIDPKTRFAFKKIFGSPQNKSILVSLLNALLYEGNSTIQDLTIIDPSQAPRIEGIKDSYLDVKAQLVDGQTVIIETQVINVPGFNKRVLYNAATAFSTQLEASDDYTMRNLVIALTIADLEMFEHGEQVVSRYRLKEKSTLSDYSDDIELVFVDLPKFTLGIDELTTLTDKWLYFLKEANHLKAVPASLEQECAIHDAFDVARQGRLTRDEMEILDRQAMFIHDSRNAVRLGIEQGIAQGIEQRRLEGIEEGRRTVKVEIARSLINKLPMEEIAYVTGLSVDEITQMSTVNN